jgi:hypothetical protein
MKTNKQNKNRKAAVVKPAVTDAPDVNGNPDTGKGLLSRSDNSSQPSVKAQPEAETESKPQVSIKPYVNYAEREFNRKLPVEKVLEILRRWMPRQFELAEVVGKWVWITFAEQPAERVRAELSQLGFHWNNTRKCWQHPCGETLPRGTEEPRSKYPTYHPADQIAA